MFKKSPKIDLYINKKQDKKPSSVLYGVLFLLASAVIVYILSVGDIVRFPLIFSKAEEKEIVKTEEENIKIQKKSFGKSVQGRPIEGYEIGYGKNTLLLFASIHGNEMGTADLLNQLVLEIALDKSLVSKNKKLLIIPVANPDGYQERSDNLNANGANLNLNFGTTDWQNYGPEGNYAGASPFSESESQAIKAMVEKYKPSAMISFHSHGNLISPEAGESSAELAKWYSGKTGYEYFDSWDYPGTATKWFVEATGDPAITVEISKDFQSDWDTNKGALLELISRDNWPFKSEK